MSSITLEIKLYGAFRKQGESVTIAVPCGSDMAQVKEILAESLGALVQDSVLANDDKILPNSYIFEQDAVISILPPVCGG